MPTPSIPIVELSAEESVRRPVRKLVEMVLLMAIKDRATEVHFEPRENDYRLSYRVDGQFYDIVPPPHQLAGPISQVFKVLAELDICDSRRAQLGLLRVVVGAGVAEMLVSIRPTPHGEEVLLNVESNTVTLAEAEQVLQKYLRRGEADQLMTIDF